ncbi:MAG: DUF2147 domain-containing protein [Saprospiraceae bacterium]|nr:DUF2147 domain-containing protein [Saprospiraceae bacterium]
MQNLMNLFQFTYLLLLFNFLFSSGLKAQVEFNGKGILGKWRIVDVKTDEDKTIMEIWEKNGNYFAKIVDIPGLTEEEKNSTFCKKSTDKRKGQKLVGMEIISNLQKGKEKYSEGDILDLSKGKIFKCDIWLENEDRLKVRTHVPIIYKDEVWLRKTD